MFHTFTVLLISFTILSCASGSGGSSSVPSQAGKTAYTLTNLWYEKPMKLLPIFHKGTMIPVGTKVKIEDTSSSTIEFSREDGMRFRIYSQKYYKMTGDEMAKQLFGDKNPTAKGGKFHQFSKMEREQIKRGQVKKGMSKDAVIMAYGYPPTHVNPSIEANTWQVWKNRWNRMIINFKGGKVSSIQD
jgi:hypothetical protein